MDGAKVPPPIDRYINSLPHSLSGQGPLFISSLQPAGFSSVSAPPAPFTFELTVVSQALPFKATDTMGAFSSTFTLPLILGLLALIFVIIGVVSLIRIATGKGAKDGRTIPM